MSNKTRRSENFTVVIAVLPSVIMNRLSSCVVRYGPITNAIVIRMGPVEMIDSSSIIVNVIDMMIIWKIVRVSYVMVSQVVLIMNVTKLIMKRFADVMAITDVFGNILKMSNVVSNVVHIVVSGSIYLIENISEVLS